MNDVQKVTDIFRLHPRHEFDAMTWFTRITTWLGGGGAIFLNKARPTNKGSAFIDWKPPHTKVHNDVVRLSFNHFYISAMLSLQGHWNVKDYDEIIRELIEVRQVLKWDESRHDVVKDIKIYLNMIYGQLDNGVVGMSDYSSSDVVGVAHRIIEELHNFFPEAFYSDTDEVYFTKDIRITQVDEKIRRIVGIHDFPYQFDYFKSVEIQGKKRLLMTHY